MIFKRILHKINNEKAKLLQVKEENLVRKIVQKQSQPIYHIHIRKTAGTTINFAFLSNAGVSNTEQFYESIAHKPNHRQIKSSKIFVGWNVKLIEQGEYSFAFSHTPRHQLNLKPEVFTFTCLRDPVKRVVSHYNMLKYYQLNNIDHPIMKVEGKWLGKSFDDFMVRMPKEHLLNQLYMFSSSCDLNEATDSLLSLNKIIYTENLKVGLDELEIKTGWQLPISNQKKI
ncbi:MAG: sulfotransferase family 2 domain-containing protein [Flavobacteriaceae bacterium]|nr:sulfotransferase family 2 domain-containing protein [Flavobacteriaceae bacterium]